MTHLVLCTTLSSRHKKVLSLLTVLSSLLVNSVIRIPIVPNDIFIFLLRTTTPSDIVSYNYCTEWLPIFKCNCHDWSQRSTYISIIQGDPKIILSRQQKICHQSEEHR